MTNQRESRSSNTRRGASKRGEATSPAVQAQNKGNAQPTSVARNSSVATQKEKRHKHPLSELDCVGYTIPISYEEAKEVAMIDAPKLAQSNTRDKYVEANTPQYFICINTWLLSLQELSLETMRDVRQAILRMGFTDTIALANNVASNIIKRFTVDDYGKWHTSHVLRIASEIDAGPFGALLNVGRMDMREILQVLRFPKRFTPLMATALDEAALQLCLAVNQENATKLIYHRQRSRRAKARRLWDFASKDTWSGYVHDRWDREIPTSHRQSDFVFKLLRKNINYILRKRTFDNLYYGDPKIMDDPKVRVKPLTADTDVAFTSGSWLGRSESKADKVLFERVSEYAKAHYSINDDVLYPLAGVYTLQSIPDFAELHPVPKDYRRSRMIALEAIPRLVAGTKLRKALYETISHTSHIFLNAQEPNRVAAFTASLNGAFGTIDQSSASDSFSRNLYNAVFPDWFKTRIKESGAISGKLHYKDPKGRTISVTTHMVASSGNALTFGLESVMFKAIGMTAIDIYNRFTHEHLRYDDVIVFGDDLVVPIEVYDTVMDLCRALGFKPNDEKSYGHGTKYRESCGVEFLNGADLTTKYWPRRSLALNGDAEDLASVISLEHRLYNQQLVRFFLIDCVRAIHPRMTSHAPGADCSDLWEPMPLFGRAHAPFNRKYRTLEFDDIPARERHYVLAPSVTPYEWEPRYANLEMLLYYQQLREGHPPSSDPVLALLGFTEDANRAALVKELPLRWKLMVE